MGIAFSYTTLLKAHYTRANIKIILDKGLLLGFEYFSVDNTHAFIDSNEAVDALMAENIYYTYSIEGRFKGKLFLISSHPRKFDEKEIGLIIGNFYDIDTVQYMSIFRELVNDFAVYDIAMDVE